MSKKPEDNSFFLSVAEFVSHHTMFKEGDTVLIGVSGGADSVALLHALMLYKKHTIHIGIAHLNHCLRGDESERDLLFVKQIAENLSIPFHYNRENVKNYQKKNKLSMEEAARVIRYRFLFSTAKQHGYNKIATGHHADDNAELILMNLIRGGGSDGLAGMRPVSCGGRIVRPLLTQTKKGIEHFLTTSGIPFVYDSSNSDTAFMRNRIRSELLPGIRAAYNPNIEKTLNRTAAIVSDDLEWLQGIIMPLIDKLLNRKKDGAVELSITELKKQHIAVQRRLCRKAIEYVKGDLRRISLFHTDAALELSLSSKAHTSIDLPGRIRVKKIYDSLAFVREKKNLRSVPASRHKMTSLFLHSVERPCGQAKTVMISEVGLKLRFSEISQKAGCRLSGFNHKTALLDISKLDFPIIIRNIMPGDRFTPLGMKGTQKLNRYFINNRVTMKHRNNCPVVLSGEKIIWVAGHRIDERFKVLPQTKNILKVELLLA